jgi:hypothetical protein
MENKSIKKNGLVIQFKNIWFGKKKLMQINSIKKIDWQKTK